MLGPEEDILNTFLVYQCPISDSVQCIKPCNSGCANGQICCPRRRKFPCCSVPVQNYVIPPIRKLRANNSFQLSNTTNAVENTKVNITFNKPLSQTSEHSDNNNGNISDTFLSTSLLPNETEVQTEDLITTIIEQINDSNLSQVFNDDQGFSTNVTITTDNTETTMTTDNTETTIDQLIQLTTIATVETLSDPEIANLSYFEEGTTPPTVFPDFAYNISSSNSSGNDSESLVSSFNSSFVGDESTPSAWWNNEELTSIWNVKNVDEELNKTWSSQPTKDDSGSEVSYFTAEDAVAVFDALDYQVKFSLDNLEHRTQPL